jgi:hypothetical protein
MAIRDYILAIKDEEKALHELTSIALETNEQAIFDYTEELRHLLVENNAIQESGKKLANNGTKRGILHHGGEQTGSNGGHE